MKTDKDLLFLDVCVLEKQVSELEQYEELQEKEKLLTAKLKVLQNRYKFKLSEEELDDLRLRVMALETTVDRLVNHAIDEDVLIVRERSLKRKLAALLRE